MKTSVDNKATDYNTTHSTIDVQLSWTIVFQWIVCICLSLYLTVSVFVPSAKKHWFSNSTWTNIQLTEWQKSLAVALSRSRHQIQNSTINDRRRRGKIRGRDWDRVNPAIGQLMRRRRNKGRSRRKNENQWRSFLCACVFTHHRLQLRRNALLSDLKEEEERSRSRSRRRRASDPRHLRLIVSCFGSNSAATAFCNLQNEEQVEEQENMGAFWGEPFASADIFLHRVSVRTAADDVHCIRYEIQQALRSELEI